MFFSARENVSPKLIGRLQADDPLGLDGDGVVVGDEHHGVARRVELLEHGEHLPARVGVQGAGGLVGQDHRRISRQSPGDGHPLLLAAGELGGLVAQLVAQAHHLQRHLGPLVALGPGHSRIHEGDLHVLHERQLWQQIVLLENKTQHPVADGRQLIFVHLSHILSVQQIRAGGGDVQTADDVHAGGLAGTGLAHDGHKLPLVNLKRDVIGSLDGGVAHPVELAHVLKFNERAHQKPPPGPPPMAAPPPPPGPPLIPPPILPGMPPMAAPSIIMAPPLEPEAR